MSKQAEMIDAAHKVYRDSIGTPNEEPAYEFLRAAVKASHPSPPQPDDSPCIGECDPDLVMARAEGGCS